MAITSTKKRKRDTPRVTGLKALDEPRDIDSVSILMYADVQLLLGMLPDGNIKEFSVDFSVCIEPSDAEIIVPIEEGKKWLRSIGFTG